MARKKTVLQGLSIGPDVELLLIVAAVGIAGYWLWNKYGSSAVSSIGADVSSLASDVTGSVDSIGTAAGI